MYMWIKMDKIQRFSCLQIGRDILHDQLWCSRKLQEVKLIQLRLFSQIASTLHKNIAFALLSNLKSLYGFHHNSFRATEKKKLP